MPPSAVAPLIRSVAAADGRTKGGGRADRVLDQSGLVIQRPGTERPDWPGSGRPNEPGTRGLVTVLVSRERGGSTAGVCSYLVDTWCLGLKNATGPVPRHRPDAQHSSPGYPRTNRRAEESADMTDHAVGYEDCDIPLKSGRLRVRRWGAADAPVVVCVPGLSANLCGFDRLAGQLAGDTLQLVAIDLRGRGRSEVTGAGTYGWRNHARDVLGIADAVGAPSCAIIGQSSGAAIAMTCAQLEPSRVERLVLVDLAGSPDQQSAVPVLASISRLGTVYPSAQVAIALIKQFGIIPEWDEYWDRYFTYELRDVDGGVTPASDRGAVLEDLGYGNAMYWPGPDAPIHVLWNAISMPALVLRARQEIMPGFGFILPAAEAQRFAAGVPSARVVDIDANHYTITTHDDSIAAIGAFLRTS